MENTIKKLKKVKILKKSMMEIIQHFNITDNILHYTDLEHSIKIPVIDTNNGIYDVKNNMLVLNKEHDIKDFPKLPVINDDFRKVKCNIKISDLISIDSVVSSEMKFNLSGLCIDQIDKKIIATDGNRLMIFDIEIEAPEKDQEIEIIVNFKPFLNLFKMYKNEAITEFWYDKNNIIFQIDDITFSTRLNDQKFPNYKAVMPEKYKYHIDFSPLLNTNFDTIKTGGRNNSISLFNDEMRDNKLSFYYNDSNIDDIDCNKFIIETEIVCDFNFPEAIVLNKNF